MSSTRRDRQASQLATPITLLFMLGFILVTKNDSSVWQNIGYGLMALVFGVVTAMALR